MFSTRTFSTQIIHTVNSDHLHAFNSDYSHSSRLRALGELAKLEGGEGEEVRLFVLLSSQNISFESLPKITGFTILN